MTFAKHEIKVIFIAIACNDKLDRCFNNIICCTSTKRARTKWKNKLNLRVTSSTL